MSLWCFSLPMQSIWIASVKAALCCLSFLHLSSFFKTYIQRNSDYRKFVLICTSNALVWKWLQRDIMDATGVIPYSDVLCTGPGLSYNIWSQRHIIHNWEKVSEQQRSGGRAAWRIRPEDRGCCRSRSLTDETGKSPGHIHMLIEKGLSSWQIAFGTYVTWKLWPTRTVVDRDVRTFKKRAETLNRFGFWFLAGSASPCLQTLDDKWPSSHLKWESSQRNVVIDSFFIQRLNRKKFPADRTADQTEPPAKDIASRRHNCHCLLWLIHEQYVAWAVGPCCRSEIEQRGTAHWWSCWWWLFGIVWVFFCPRRQTQETKQPWLLFIWTYKVLVMCTSFNLPWTIQCCV